MVLHILTYIITFIKNIFNDEPFDDEQFFSFDERIQLLLSDDEMDYLYSDDEI